MHVYICRDMEVCQVSHNQQFLLNVLFYFLCVCSINSDKSVKFSILIALMEANIIIGFIKSHVHHNKPDERIGQNNY